MKDLFSNKLSWGVTLIFFGLLFLIKELHVLPAGLAEEAFSLRNFPLYAGIIFLATKSYKASIIFFAVAIILRLDQIIDLTRSLSHYIWPLLLVVAGVILLLARKGKK
ncbi:MAG: hypothetical protein M0P12_04045 [Paludibacteraceae bacterium]|jgi:hypothetical protein|nr:hypothetical protein [Paludibacteraceae bacterium]HOI27709.1 hypothetical protein [Paludibacteraceae bacterium]HOU68588.1 hypothetical protein [Paludibacteraceae bacterium]HPH63789.1 hypothetical protein [Paludibacteraceae bacterium]HQF50420.1 hypothetical protein [Paludibacteraceae bacterium]